jgi:hypothetical protein
MSATLPPGGLVQRRLRHPGTQATRSGQASTLLKHRRVHKPHPHFRPPARCDHRRRRVAGAPFTVGSETALGTIKGRHALHDVNQHQPASSRETSHPECRSAGQGSPSGATSPNATRPTQNMPSPGRQASEMASHKKCCSLGRVGGVWHLVGLPQGLPHGSPGAEPDDARTGRVEGCPRAAVWSGCARPTRCHTAPARKIFSDPVVSLRSLLPNT